MFQLFILNYVHYRLQVVSNVMSGPAGYLDIMSEFLCSLVGLYSMSQVFVDNIIAHLCSLLATIVGTPFLWVENCEEWLMVCKECEHVTIQVLMKFFTPKMMIFLFGSIKTHW